MKNTPLGELYLEDLRPKRNLQFRLMFDGGWKWLTLAGMLFALIAAVTVFVAAFSIAREQRFEKEGKVATATIEKKDTYTTTDEDSDSGRTYTTTHYRVFYTFDIAGKRFQGKGELSKRRWQELSPGDAIEVEYLASDASKNRLVEARQGKTVWLFVLMPAVFFAIAVILLVIVGRRASKHARLLAHGTLTTGTVEEKTERQDITINNRHPYTVHFRFKSPDGESHTGKELVTNFKFAAKLDVGKPLGVIYLPDNPGQSTIFRESWVKFFERA